MGAFFAFLKVLLLCTTALTALFLVLVALPQSMLRSIVLEIIGWAAGIASASLILSPVDLIPDIIPVAGQVDDFFYLLCAVASFYAALKKRSLRLNAPPDAPDHAGTRRRPAPCELRGARED
jgi:uncharacterized membrane protein YkvA (DUF1232 family)